MSVHFDSSLLDPSEFTFKNGLQNCFTLLVLFTLLTAALDFILETVIGIWENKAISSGKGVKCHQSEKEKVKGHSFLVISILHSTHFGSRVLK
jgi:hypothetical protein